MIGSSENMSKWSQLKVNTAEYWQSLWPDKVEYHPIASLDDLLDDDSFDPDTPVPVPTTISTDMPMELKYTLTLTSTTFAVGFLTGALTGARLAGLQYTAEHSHYKPASKHGWYLYHKRKNYTMAWHGIRKGLLFGSRFGAMCGCFYATDVCMDLATDGAVVPWTSVLSGAGTALVFSRMYKLTPTMRSSALKAGLLAGASFSLVNLLCDLCLRADGKDAYEHKYGAQLIPDFLSKHRY